MNAFRNPRNNKCSKSALPPCPLHLVSRAAEPSVVLCSQEHDRCQMTGWPNTREYKHDGGPRIKEAVAAQTAHRPSFCS